MMKFSGIKMKNNKQSKMESIMELTEVEKHKTFLNYALIIVEYIFIFVLFKVYGVALAMCMLCIK